MPANEFAIPRMDPGKQRPIESIDEARDWERLFIGEIKAGRDPRLPRTPQGRSRHGLRRRLGVPRRLLGALRQAGGPAQPRRRSAAASACSRSTSGELPLHALEEPDDINRFKTDSAYAEDVETATMHRVLETLRAAMNWGMAQTPPLFNESPFHRFGVRLNKKAETSRDRDSSRTRKSACSTRRCRR